MSNLIQSMIVPEVLDEKVRATLQTMLRHKMEATPGPYKVDLGRIKPPRFDIVPESNSKYIVAHCHIVSPTGDINNNWHNDCEWIVSACNNFELLLNTIDQLENEVKRLKGLYENK